MFPSYKLCIVNARTINSKIMAGSRYVYFRQSNCWSTSLWAEYSLVQDSRARLNCPNPSRIPGPSCDAFLRTFEVKST